MTAPTAPSAGFLDRWPFWVSQLAAAAAPMLLLVAWALQQYGYTSTYWPSRFEILGGPLLGVGILVSALFAWAGTFIPSTETEAALRHLTTLAATSILTAFAGLPLWLNISTSSITGSDLGWTFTSYAVLLVGYWGFVGVFTLIRQRRQAQRT